MLENNQRSASLSAGARPFLLLMLFLSHLILPALAP